MMTVCSHFKWSKRDFLSLNVDELEAAMWVAAHEQG